MRKTLITLILCFAIFSCNKNDYILESKISAEIIQKKELNLSNYNDFEWDSLIIISPYSSLEKIATENKLNLENVSESIESLDDINLIIFLKDRKAVKTCELKRMYGDFSGIYGQIIPKNKANFYMTGDIFPKNPAKLHLK
ncbi:hypothetical protein J5295_09675 [Riemerella anatipestifer]|uniref:Lipoprotein n=1 Tax=Riemerella anatipestifer (strain ATCC 11845 / DSM 15868 / JCM 9532 / NCTC 11014) TaxID=693978 RepID=E4TDX3_RIEAD|nr:hypothetical protein [Riemerella anatipestifer]ADQ82982.1 hypothetical protein Riean_1829 [Riemerella anatipestifer ATCC 11845 = DSM 15868]ADZ11529.1 hypothetical protein RIA_0350 [Riemerella anatipestifer RA-GD]AFD55052.1 hypothetical protein RA0C_0029 [Riemerella anatipestifer ATCC 11845 = DSM 15868]AGC41031.1 hypothetical protein G148_1727 [Riemerella anatipestifer RA-CH-2]AKP70146.1 hypothetical protein CG08_2071 [Riemerella anatipestifer]